MIQLFEIAEEQLVKLYEIYESEWYRETAGFKAPEDVSHIVRQLGFHKLVIHRHNSSGLIRRFICCVLWVFELIRLFIIVSFGSVVFFQYGSKKRLSSYGAFGALKFLKKVGGVRIIVLIHDVEELRGWFSMCSCNLRTEVYELFGLADVLIVHNSAMKQALVDMGVDEKKMVTLEIFDYLIPSFPFETRDSIKVFAVSIAGNLEQSKAVYAWKLSAIPSIEWHLYGPTWSNDTPKGKNVYYHGTFPPDKLPNELQYGFGLVWDGTSLETCAGNIGEYLKFNNPHKLSLYLASGLPILIWDQAAEAEYVQKNGLGMSISSLYDIESVFRKLTYEEYNRMKGNVADVSKRLREGFYTKRSVQRALEMIRKDTSCDC